MIQPPASGKNKQGICSDLHATYGPLVGGSDLARLLGFKNMEAFRQAVHRKRLPIKVFELKNRRGKFAFTEDLTRWLADLQT